MTIPTRWAPPATLPAPPAGHRRGGVLWLVERSHTARWGILACIHGERWSPVVVLRDDGASLLLPNAPGRAPVVTPAGPIGGVQRILRAPTEWWAAPPGPRAFTDPAALVNDAMTAAMGRPMLPPVRRPVDSVRNALCGRPDRRWSLAELATIAGLSRFHCLRVFREGIGLTPHQYLRQVRVRRAVCALLDGRVLSAIALETGFADQSHLTRTVRAIVGMPPGTLRDLLCLTNPAPVPPAQPAWWRAGQRPTPRRSADRSIRAFARGHSRLLDDRGLASLGGPAAEGGP